jgi:hypothetical protein
MFGGAPFRVATHEYMKPPGTGKYSAANVTARSAKQCIPEETPHP